MNHIRTFIDTLSLFKVWQFTPKVWQLTHFLTSFHIKNTNCRLRTKKTLTKVWQGLQKYGN